MQQIQRFTLLLLSIVSILTLPASTRADAGDKIIRGGLSYVTPTKDTRLSGTGTEDFLDPTRPPLVRFDVTADHLFGVDSDFGLGVDFEYLLTDLIGLTGAFNYSRQPARIDFGGQITFTPYLGQPPTLVAELNETAPIVGIGTGRADLLLLTAGANFHVLQRERLDLYAGPIVGLAHTQFDVNSGSFSAAFPSFTSVTPLEQSPFSDGATDKFVLGAAFGVDIPIGAKGWLVSTGFKYVSVENLEPWLVQISLGHRF